MKKLLAYLILSFFIIIIIIESILFKEAAAQFLFLIGCFISLTIIMKYLFLYLLTTPLGYYLLKLAGPPINTLLDQLIVCILSLVWPLSSIVAFIMCQTQHMKPF